MNNKHSFWIRNYYFSLSFSLSQNLKFLGCVRLGNILSPRSFAFTTADRALVARSGSRAIVKQRGLVSSNSSKHRRQGWPTKKCHHLAPRSSLLRSPLLSFPLHRAPINFLARLSKRWWDHKFRPVPNRSGLLTRDRHFAAANDPCNSVSSPYRRTLGHRRWNTSGTPYITPATPICQVIFTRPPPPHAQLPFTGKTWRIAERILIVGDVTGENLNFILNNVRAY